VTRITCKEFDEVVHGFVRMELLDVNVREAVLEHAAQCDACSQRLAEAAALAEDAELLGQSAREQQTPPAVEAALLRAFRSQHQSVSWRRAVEWASIGAAAAVLLVFLWLAAGGPKKQFSPAQEKDSGSPAGVPLDARVDAVTKQGDVTPVAAPVRASASVAGTYVASDFVPVPFTGGITADDPGMIVRVQLTRASLAQLGYPVAETPDEDLIPADILVGEDGWPRGVKLIRK
jgi:hypothetical protein